MKVWRVTVFMIAVLIMQCMARMPQVSDSSWSVLPICGGGYVQNVVIAPSNTNVWYSYVDVGGPYRSDDCGRHWRPLHGNFELEDRFRNADHVRSLSIDPRDENKIVFVGGNAFSNPGGIYVSTNGGVTFCCRQTARFYGNGRCRKMHGLCLARNPNNPDELVAGEDWDGIFISRDNGMSWKSSGLKECWFTDIKYDLFKSRRVYASAPPITMTPRSEHNPHAPRKSGFWISEDSGETWVRVLENAPLEIVQHPGSGDLLGVFGSSVTDIRISKDGGLTWTDYGKGLLPADLSKPWYFTGYFALAASKDFYLVGHAEGDIYIRWTDADTWCKVERKSLIAGSREERHILNLRAVKNMRFEALGSIVVSHSNSRHWIATDWYSIWESFDFGATWTSRVNGMMQLVSSTLAFDPLSSENIYYGVADMGYFRSDDGGKTYNRPSWPAPYASSFAFSHFTSGLMYATGGKKHTSLFRSFNSGRSWEPLSNTEGLPDSRIMGCNAYGVATDPLTDDVFLSVGGKSGPTGGGVYRSRDKGETWERFSEGLPEGVELFRNKEFSEGPGDALYFSKDGSCLLATRKIRRLWRLDRNKSRWCELALPPTDGIIGVDPFVEGRFVLCGTPMLESIDGGRTFNPNNELPQGCWSIAFDAHTLGLAMLGNRDGFWISRDGLHTAALLPGGLSFPSGSGRRVFVDRKRLFAFSSGSGVWVRKLE